MSTVNPFDNLYDWGSDPNDDILAALNKLEANHIADQHLAEIIGSNLSNGMLESLELIEAVFRERQSRNASAPSGAQLPGLRSLPENNSMTTHPSDDLQGSSSKLSDDSLALLQYVKQEYKQKPPSDNNARASTSRLPPTTLHEDGYFMEDHYVITGRNPQGVCIGPAPAQVSKSLPRQRQERTSSTRS